MLNQNFLIAFIVCLFGYLFHTLTHFLEYKGKQIKLPHIFFEIIIFSGYVAWGFMIAFDPIKIGLSNYIVLPIGLLISLIGFYLFISAVKAKKGFEKIDNLVNFGIYSKIRHPMYLGLIFIHIGFPLITKSFLTLISIIIWIPQILLWKYWEEKDLKKRFGKKYIEYKKRTLF